MERSSLFFSAVHVETHLLTFHRQLTDGIHIQVSGSIRHYTIQTHTYNWYILLFKKLLRYSSGTASRRPAGGAHREACPLLRQVWNAEGSGSVALGRFLVVGVVQHDALEATANCSEGQAQLHHPLRGIGDGEEHPPSLRGWTHLHEQPKQAGLKV